MKSLLSSGDNGSWFFNCAVSSVKKVSKLFAKLARFAVPDVAAFAAAALVGFEDVMATIDLIFQREEIVKR